MEFDRNKIDLIICNLYNGTAKYKRSYTYSQLEKNWEDERAIPKIKEMEKEYKNIKNKNHQKNKLKKKYQKELNNFIWKEVRKNKDGDLDNSDLFEIDKEINK